ncbi:MAG: YraN family protein [Gammaproteobacteria bacterium]|nr:YraN family protein [Gammaproteobacteria bacterium]
MNHAIGRYAEEYACRYLQQRGLSLVQCNYRCPLGEVDLIMRHGDTLVFVEVRYRRRRDFGSGAESVDARKQARVAAAALHYLQRTGASTRHPARFDVIAMTPGNGPPNVEWIADAFQR